MRIRAISISDRKGIRKTNISEGELREGFGLAGDAHGGSWHRQVSLLAQESIETMRAKGLDVVAGNFAENITTEGIDLSLLSVGDHLAIGKTEVVISQLGKVCHHRCAIYHQAGDCVMPREGVFAIVHRGGTVRVGDAIGATGRRSPAVGVVCTEPVEKMFGRGIVEAVTARWAPAFTRCDRLREDGANLSQLLDDLSGRQMLDRVIVFDPEERYGLGVAAYAAAASTASIAAQRISHCTTTEAIVRLPEAA